MSRIDPAAGRKLLPREAAERLGISVQTLRAWARSGKIDCHRDQSGRRRLYAQADIDAILERFAEVTS